MRSSLRKLLVAAACAALLVATPAIPENRMSDTEAWERAVALVGERRPRDAVPILERLVLAHPDQPTVRLELGFAQYLAGRDDAARRNITQALAGEVSPEERAGGEALLRRLDARRVWSGSLALSMISAGNAAREPADRTVMIGGLPFVLDPPEDPGTGVRLDARIGASPRLGEDWRARFLLGLSGDFHANRDFEDRSLRTEAGLMRETDRLLLGGGPLIAERRVGGARFSREAGAWASLTARPGPTTRVGARAEAVRRTGHDGRTEDADIFRLSLNVERALAPRTSILLRGFAAVTDAESPRMSGLQTGLGGELRHLFDGGWSGSLGISLTRDARNGPEPLFGLTRRDADIRITTRISNRKLQLGGFSPAVELGHERRRSTLSIAEFSNSWIGLGVQRDF